MAAVASARIILPEEILSTSSNRVKENGKFAKEGKTFFR